MLKTVPAFDRIGEENAFAVLARATQLAAQGRDAVDHLARLVGFADPLIEVVAEVLLLELEACQGERQRHVTPEDQRRLVLDFAQIPHKVGGKRAERDGERKKTEEDPGR